MKFAFVDAEKANHGIRTLCRVLQVSRAGYYSWARREPSERAKRDAELNLMIKQSFERSRKTYGSPRVHEDLKELGERVSRKRVARLMRSQGLVARSRKRFRVSAATGAGQPIAANVLAREFGSKRPNQRWVGDTTELTTPHGRIFLAALLDLYSRMVVGWAVSAVNDRHLVMHALRSALQRRRPDQGLLHHTDQGSPYTSEDYQRLLRAHGLKRSMSRRGNCYDNAVMESFFATLKAELGERFDSARTAKAALFDYIEVFYNLQRRHSALGNISPGEYERQATQPAMAA